ncbi:hypothetical protein L1987_57489 [Smallanthus sonchifolius]|uniref:Uncharacterized protein n=1 Tax=Smallanthus sonchifolius TaxID=185202 RepID=A0ACB9DCS1_9ASTR|nr:hypothetical protein L1987_57489 [Smallanthus sonchifolius]
MESTSLCGGHIMQGGFRGGHKSRLVPNAHVRSEVKNLEQVRKERQTKATKVVLMKNNPKKKFKGNKFGKMLVKREREGNTFKETSATGKINRSTAVTASHVIISIIGGVSLLNKWNREAAIDAAACVNPRFTPSSVLRISRVNFKIWLDNTLITTEYYCWQLRNRDAALRSRERKKMLVKDLEMKSRYYEGECRRLGSLLQWYMAENQALRFSLHSNSSSNASMTKQESVVLLLESLLLGSLLWLMGIVVVLPSLVLLLILRHQSQSQLVTAVEEKHLPSLAPRKGGNTLPAEAYMVGEIHRTEEHGTILAFLTSQMEVEWAVFKAPSTVSLPLHGKLSREEQYRMYLNYPSKRKVIFSTNLDETSLTIPGVNYVVDSGMVKESRFEPRTGMNVLKVCSISQSSANQRAGRAGRTEPGQCMFSCILPVLY